MTCQDVARQFDAWLAGSLNDADARRLEQHAATCAVCGEQLDAMSRGTNLVPGLEPPVALREATLRAVARRRSAARWRNAVAVAAAVAAIVVVATILQPHRKSAGSFPRTNRLVLARDRARTDFAELDGAEREVQTALDDRPDDVELAGALARIRGERQVLQQVVSQAAQ